MNIFESVDKFNSYIPGKKTRNEILDIQRTLLREEYREVMEEFDMEPVNNARLLKELVDLIYVAIGTATRLDLPIEAAVEAVALNNLTKVEREGGPIIRGGKIQKPEGYKDVDMAEVMRSHRQPN